VKLVAIGDSCTYGQNVRSEEAWPALLGRMTGHDVRNAGVCGDTTRLALERFPKDVQLHKPDVVVIQFGANDCNIWDTDNGLPRVSADAYAANVSEMVSRAWAFGGVGIVLSPYPAPGKERSYNRRLASYISALDNLGIGTHGPPDISVLDDGYGLHPDQAMHVRFARLVQEAL
jgi:lysophospholipase L1-like esterase